MNSSTEAYKHGALAGVARHPRGHQQHRRPNALAAAVLDVVADGRNDGDLRLHVPSELALDLRESSRIGSNICARVAAEGFCAVGFTLVHQTISARGVSTRGTPNSCQELSYGPNRRTKFSPVASATCSGVVSAQRSDRLGHAHDVRRLVPRAAMGHRREKRAVGFDQQTIERHHPGHFVQLRRSGKVTMPASDM